ncbi:MAG: hypothetical protein AAFY56_12750, partial [Pseudomonadota bacterium]
MESYQFVVWPFQGLPVIHNRLAIDHQFTNDSKTASIGCFCNQCEPDGEAMDTTGRKISLLAIYSLVINDTLLLRLAGAQGDF